VRAGLLVEAAESTPSAAPPPTVARRTSLTTAIRGLVLCSLFIIVGGAVIQYLATRNDDAATARRSNTALPLVPRQPGYLRVVVDPWADVIVDGQKVDTTPFARSIPLSAGTHYVRLEHPNAAPERRTVRLVPGETVLLDVKMNVESARRGPGATEAEPWPGAPDAGVDAPFSP
jgi:serine/threonine-protein kinase